MRDFCQNNVARLHRWEGIVAGPGGGVRLAVAGDVTGLERLEHHAAIAKVIVAHFVDIMLAAVEGQVSPPPVGVLDVSDVPARLERTDHIGTRPDDGVQRRDGEILTLPLRLFQDRPQPQDQRQFAVFGVEGEADRARPGLFGLGDLGPGRGIARASLGSQGFKGPEHVFRGDRASVRESGTFAQGKGDEAAGLVRLDRFGQKTIKRERFVVRAPHQRFDSQGRHSGGGIALQDEGIERIKSPRLAENDSAPLGRLRVGIGQRHKIGWKGRVAIHSYAMHRLCQQGLGKQAQGQGRRSPQTGQSLQCHCRYIPVCVLRCRDAIATALPFQTFSLECPAPRRIRRALLDRFLACMKPAS